MKLTQEQQHMLSVLLANNIPAEALADIVFAPKSGIFRLYHQES